MIDVFSWAPFLWTAVDLTSVYSSCHFLTKSNGGLNVRIAYEWNLARQLHRQAKPSAPR
jgi:hypothetical protein